MPYRRETDLLHLTPPQIAEWIRSDPRLLVPVGACEQHGPHLPLGAGTLVAEALVDDLSREFGVLRAPTAHYGANIPTREVYAGTASLKPKTLHRMLNELVASWEAHGFAEIIAITASQYDPHVEAVATVRAPKARVRVVEALSVDLSSFMEGPARPQHGGEVLTSLLLHLNSEVVRMDSARDFVPDESKDWGRLRRLPKGSPGSVGRPGLANAEKGRAMYEHILQKIRHKVFLAPPASDG
jgi:creatinine amidohydrolase